MLFHDFDVKFLQPGDLQDRRDSLEQIVKKCQGMLGHFREELRWLSNEKAAVVKEAQETVEAERAKAKAELAKVLAREHELLAAAIVAPTRPSSRTHRRGSPRRRKTSPTTQPRQRKRRPKSPGRKTPEEAIMSS